jgi:hypothetical protein
MLMSLVKNRLKIYGSVKHIIKFIQENYESDCYHPSDGNNPPNYILFFGALFPTPDDIVNDKDKVYRYRMNNWGTPFLADNQFSTLTVFYKHDYDYTAYELTSDNDKFNSYSIRKLSEYSEMFYGENIHPDENMLITFFDTTMTPPSKLFTHWINLYRGTSLIFKLDYWDEQDRFVGNIHYDYKTKTYVLEHHVKEHDHKAYIYYMLDEEVKTIEMYSEELTNLVIETNPTKSDKDFNEIKDMMMEEIESKSSFEEQVNFISMLLLYLENKKSVKENP